MVQFLVAESILYINVTSHKFIVGMNQQNVNDEEPPHSVNANNYEDDDNSDYGSDKEEED